MEASGPSSLDELLAATPIPADFELLSIAVDGEDFHIRRGMTLYRPKIVIIEINSSLPPDVEQTHGSGREGSSFASTARLGREKGYATVCHTGNAILVRDDLVSRLMLPADDFAHPETLFVRSWLPPTTKVGKLVHKAKADAAHIRGRFRAAARALNLSAPT